MKYLNGLDLTQTELHNAIMHPLPGAPADPLPGQMYYDTATKYVYHWDGEHWVNNTGMLFLGTYSGSVQYYAQNLVTYNGSDYVATSKPPLGTVPTNTSYWAMFATTTAGDVTYTNVTPTTATVGGIAQGSTFTADTVQQMFDLLLYPYQSPAFSAFTMSGQSSNVEVGTTISGSKTFTWSTTNSGNVASNSIAISDLTRGTTLTTGEANDGSATGTVASLQKTVPATNTWRITASNTNSSSFIRDYTVTWMWQRYYGTSTNTTLTEAQVKALTSSGLSSTGFGTYSFGTTSYKYIAYPASLPAATNFTDTSTQLSVDMADPEFGYNTLANGKYYNIVNITNAQGIATDYRLYRTKYVLGGAINVAVS